MDISRSGTWISATMCSKGRSWQISKPHRSMQVFAWHRLSWNLLRLISRWPKPIRHVLNSCTKIMSTRLAQSDPVRLFVNVPQADVTSVKAGTAATVTVDEFPGQTFDGEVARDAGAFDQASRTLLLEIDVPNPDGRLYAGMYAHGTFALKNPTPALLVPDNSILIDSKGPRVLVVDSSDKIHVKSVTLGRVSFQ